METDQLSKSDWLRWVVDRYQGPLIRVAFRITGNLEVAREVTQDTFLRLCRQEQRMVDGQLTSWLFTVCRNRALDVLKKERRLQPVEDEEFWFQDGRGKTPAESAAHRDSYEMVQRLIATLSPRDQDVLRFKFEYGMSYREIAEALGLSESNVGFILHQSIRKIRQHAKSAEEEPARITNRLLQ